MQEDFHDPDQQTFDELILPPREHARGDEAAAAAVSFTACGAARQAELIKLRRMLLEYLGKFEIGHEFQAIDFGYWLDSQADQPDEEILDRRASGGLFVNLVNAGVLEQVGAKNNGGDKSRGYHGTLRVIYRIASHDFTALGWLEGTHA